MTYRLAKNEVHIWRACFDWPQDKLDDAFKILSQDEQARAARFVMAKHRKRYIAAHAALRQILSGYVKRTPGELIFYQNKHGKPYLSDLPADLSIQFNMSDSKAFGLYGVTLGAEIGVDIEYIKPDIQLEEIAQRFFSPSEYEALLALSAAQRLEAFYRCWTRKEAYIKVIGQGLSFNLDRFVVSLKRDGLDCLLRVDGSSEHAQRWCLGPIQAPNHYQAAVAVAGKVSKITYFDFQK